MIGKMELRAFFWMRECYENEKVVGSCKTVGYNNSLVEHVVSLEGYAY